MTTFGGTTEAEPLTPQEEAQLAGLLTNPMFYPEVFKDWISELTHQQVTPGLPFSDILRSDQLAGQVNLLPSISPTYAQHLVWKDAGSVVGIPGPCDAMVFFMGSSYNWTGDFGYLALSVNGAAPDNNLRMALRGEVRRVFGARGQYVNLPNDTNTVGFMCMKDGSGDVDFQDLCIAIFRIFS